MGFEAPGVSPETVKLFDKFEVPETMITLWVVTVIVAVFCILMRTVFIKRFKDRPGKFQNIVELCVEFINKMTVDKVGKAGAGAACFVLFVAIILVTTSIGELVAVRAPATDINFTLALSLFAFGIMNIYGVKTLGLKTRLKSFGEPVKPLYPIKLLTHLITPISMACRLFGNMFSGLIVMELLYYAMGYFAIGIPAVLSIYFNLFHIGMQSYVFMTLTLAFTGEAMEKPEPKPKKLKKARR